MRALRILRLIELYSALGSCRRTTLFRNETEIGVATFFKKQRLFAISAKKVCAALKLRCVFSIFKFVNISIFARIVFLFSSAEPPTPTHKKMLYTLNHVPQSRWKWLEDPWNLIDFMVCVAGWAEMVFYVPQKLPFCLSG